jgi:hypothetical protein
MAEFAVCHVCTGLAAWGGMKLRLSLAGLTAFCGLAIATTASAAPATPCVPATMTPLATSFPANLPAFGYTATTATASDVHLFATGTTRTEIPLTVGPAIENGYLKVVPTTPLVAGTSYELQYQAFCSYGAYPPSKPLTFTATADAPLPTTLGELTSGPTVTLTDYGTTQVAIAATYSIAAEMKPWAGVYQLGIVFDGKVVETHATVAAAGDAVKVDATGWCDAASAATNKHTVQLRGRLPFAPSVETTSAPLDFVCPPPRIGTPPNNGAVPPTTGASSSGSSGNNDGGTSSTSTTGGCSTSPGSAPASAASIGLVLGLAALVRRRVRRARRISGEWTARRRT